MITTIMKNISKTDTKLIWKKISHFTPNLTYTPNKLKNSKGMVKTFWPFKTLFHTYTHSHAFQANFKCFTEFWTHLGTKWILILMILLFK